LSFRYFHPVNYSSDLNLAMLARRLEMVILSAPRPLESISRIVFSATSDSEKMTHMNRQFIPLFRYHNPKLQVDFNRLPSDAEQSSGELKLVMNDETTMVNSLDKPVHHLAQWIIDSSAKPSS